MAPYAVLAHLKATLAILPGVVSCKIGLEANVTATDYPLIRIVPTRMMPQDAGAARRRIQVTIYFGAKLLESLDGLEAVYEALLTLEGQIRDAVLLTAVQAARAQREHLRAEYLDTITDEDRLKHYKLMACRFEVES